MIKIFRTQEDISLHTGKQKGVSISLRWKSAVDGTTPFYNFRIFVWGTFLKFNPHTSSRCCSNGVVLFCKSTGNE